MLFVAQSLLLIAVSIASRFPPFTLLVLCFPASVRSIDDGVRARGVSKGAPCLLGVPWRLVSLGISGPRLPVGIQTLAEGSNAKVDNELPRRSYI